MNRIATLSLTLALAAALPAAALAQDAAPATDAMTAPQVRAALTAEGYTAINDVEFEEGLWKADARSADGNRVEVRIDPATGNQYPSTAVATLGAADIEARLATAGYLKVHDLDFEDGLWHAEAEDAQGVNLELKIDPATGEVIGREKD